MNFLIYVAIFSGTATFSTWSASHTQGVNTSIAADVVKAISGPEPRIAVLFAPQHATQATRVVRDLNVPWTTWTSPRPSASYRTFVRYVTQFPDDYPRPAIVLVPHHSTVPSQVLKEIPRFQKYHSNVDWVFSVKEHADVLDRLRNHSCQVITVTVDDISAPYDGYRSCQVRKHFREPRVLLFKDAPRKGLYPKHERVYYAVRDRPGNYCGENYGNRATITIEAYRALNNSLVYRCNNDDVDQSALLERQVDIIAGLRSPNCPDHCFAYRYAMYPPTSRYYLVRRSTTTRPSFFNVWLWFFFVSFLFMATFAVVFILVLQHRRRFHSEDTFSTSAAAMFLVSSFLGRSPPPGMESRAMSSKILLFSWMLGMLFLGTFIQTSITASRSVPSITAEIKSMRELLERLDDGTILLCTSNLEAARIERETSAVVSYIQTFRRALDRCATECALDDEVYWKYCISKIKDGTHAGVFPYTAYSVATAVQDGLEPGEDIFMSQLTISAAHGRFPLRHQHRRLHMAIEESGLLSVIERKRSPVQRDTTLRDSSTLDEDTTMASSTAHFVQNGIFVGFRDVEYT
ncbi:hypothetical protein HPB50_008431 [Hyalomma asiaticum]|uniref:Uncharacterized protein n=1 Tax=Hyalomma asiaticum TaxID=266040 RepID=A0ACB7T909_HYAAI|nr:hypothetical protein HPB50_008431 [Hyalomma asiaticum]